MSLKTGYMDAEHDDGSNYETPAKDVIASKAAGRRRIFLLAIAAAIGAFYLVFAWRTFVLQYYPSPPFFYDEGDSLADWLNTCSWTERSDRYTTWQSLYTPFSHLTCWLFRPLTGFIPLEWFNGWRQFSLGSRLVLLLHIGLWFSILAPLKPYNSMGDNSHHSICLYRLKQFPFKVLTLFSYGSLYSFERGNLLSICFVLFLASFRIGYLPLARPLIQDLLLAVGASIKPYMVLFSNYGWNAKRLLRTICFAGVLQLVAVLIIGAPGIENMPSNLAFFSKNNAITDVLTRALNTFTFKGYLDLIKLVSYGQSDEIFAYRLTFMLNLLYGIGVSLFVVLAVLGARCLLQTWKYVSIHRSCKPSTPVDPLMSSIAPSCVMTFVYLVQAQGSGAYVILFPIATLLWLEEETSLISSSPLLLSLYFVSICAFDIPWSTAKSYSCGFPFKPLLTEIFGQSYTCLGSYVGVFSVLRPLLALLFGIALFMRIFNILRLRNRALKIC